MVCPCCAPSCGCESGRVAFPSSITASLEVGEVIGSPDYGVCDSRAIDWINGTYVLPLIGDGLYRFSDGSLIMTFVWKCHPGSFASFSDVTGLFDLIYCNETPFQCVTTVDLTNDAIWFRQQAATGSDAWPSLCSYAGSASASSNTVGVDRAIFWRLAGTCTSSTGIGASYKLSLTITA